MLTLGTETALFQQHFLAVAAGLSVAMIRPEFHGKSAMPVDAPETIEVDDTRVACDGIGGSLGHPKVYLEMGDEKYVECPYCDRRFVLRAGAHAH
jgi:uncharacterized Zn-finger protein